MNKKYFSVKLQLFFWNRSKQQKQSCFHVSEYTFRLNHSLLFL